MEFFGVHLKNFQGNPTQTNQVFSLTLSNVINYPDVRARCPSAAFPCLKVLIRHGSGYPAVIFAYGSQTEATIQRGRLTNEFVKPMKLILSSLLFLVLATPAFANEIDDLKTFADVTQFLKAKVLPKTFESVILDPVKANTSTRFGKHSFHKLDLDGNGLTDLVVDGYYFLAVIDQGKGKHDLQSLDR